MDTIELLASTGDPRIDRILCGAIGIFETVFPDRIRSYYLIGSYADGTAIPKISDIDGFVIFKNDFLGEVEKERASRLCADCGSLTEPDFDVIPIPEAGLKRLGHVNMKLSSTLIYGEDIRDQIPLPEVDLYGHVLLFETYRFLSRVRGNPPFLTYPLDYPDPGADYYGYERRMAHAADGSVQPSTKALINCVGKPALAIVTVEAKVLVRNKTECLIQYKNHVDDEWSSLLEDVYTQCRERWHYRIPETQDE